MSLTLEFTKKIIYGCPQKLPKLSAKEGKFDSNSSSFGGRNGDILNPRKLLKDPLVGLFGKGKEIVRVDLALEDAIQQRKLTDTPIKDSYKIGLLFPDLEVDLETPPQVFQMALDFWKPVPNTKRTRSGRQY